MGAAAEKVRQPTPGRVTSRTPGKTGLSLRLLEILKMPGPNIAVLVQGPGLPSEGRRWAAYKSACRELHLDRTKRQRHEDRARLKAGESLRISQYVVKRCL